MTTVRIACLTVALALMVFAVWRDGKRGAMMVLEGIARGVLIGATVDVAYLVGGSVGGWISVPFCWAASWFGGTSLGMLNFLLLQWFGVRLARHVRVGRVPCRCIHCGETVQYDPELSSNINDAGGCQDDPDLLHVGEVFDGTPRQWRILRWAWPLTGWGRS